MQNHCWTNRSASGDDEGMPRTTRLVRPGLVLGICCLSLLIVGVDNTIVTIGLPQIRQDMHASFSAAQWTVDAYQLVLGAFLLTAGATADRWGRRLTLQTGLAVFTIASALCAAAPTIGWLIGSRVVQALGGSMMNPVAIAIVTQVYPDARRRAHAFGIWSGVYGLSMAIGPVLGGFLVQHAGWRSIFWVNIPIGVIAIGLCAWAVPESKSPTRRRFDAIGQALVVVILLALTYAIIEGNSLGWASARIIVLAVIVLVCAAALVWWEGRVPEPVVDPLFFRSAPFSGAILIALIGMGGTAGYLWVVTFYLQDARGLSPASAGALMLPIAAMVLIVAPLSGRLAARHGPRIPLAISGCCVAISAALLTHLHQHTSLLVLLMSFVVFGIGFGMLNAPITNAAVAGMPKSQAAVASAVASTGRQVGQALGVAIVGAVVVNRINLHAVATSLPAASRPGWWVVTAAGALVVVIAILTTTRRARRATERVRELLDEEHPEPPDPQQPGSELITRRFPQSEDVR